jgi:hypothetical protein
VLSLSVFKVVHLINKKVMPFSNVSKFIFNERKNLDKWNYEVIFVISIGPLVSADTVYIIII